MNNTSLINKTTYLISNTSNYVSDGKPNFTTSKYTDIFFKEGSCPKWLIYIYLVLFFFGFCVNLVESFALIRCKKNGVLSIILQITLVDTLLFFVAVLEICTSYHRSWKFSTYTCMTFRGSEILANTLNLYLLVCLNFHVITFWNLHNFEAIKNKNPLTSFNESSSSECLVTRSENRVLAIDYRKRKDDISVLFPSMLMWFICLSISIPNFVLSSTVVTQGTTLCVIIENVYGVILHCLLLVFSTTVPCFLLLISFLVIIYKLSKTSQEDIDNVLTKKFDEIRRLLIFCIVLTIFYMLTSYQRYIFNMNVTIERTFLFYNNNNYNDYSYVYQTMLHYSGASVRGIICYYMVPNLKKIILDKLCFCRNKDT